jgi:hypothetical protein
MNCAGASRPRRVRPAHERLRTDDLSRLKIDDRLIVELEFCALQRALELAGQFEAVEHALVRSLFEGLNRAVARVLGRIHGCVGVTQQLVDAERAVAPRETDRRTDLQLAPRELKRRSHGVQQSRPDRLSLAVVVTDLEYHADPHILVRFYTNPDGSPARRTTVRVLGWPRLTSRAAAAGMIVGGVGRHGLAIAHAARNRVGPGRVCIDDRRLADVRPPA